MHENRGEKRRKGQYANSVHRDRGNLFEQSAAHVKQLLNSQRREKIEGAGERERERERKEKRGQRTAQERKKETRSSGSGRVNKCERIKHLRSCA